MLALYHLLPLGGLDTIIIPIIQSAAPTTKHMATIPSSINHGIIQSASEVTWGLLDLQDSNNIEILISVADLLVLHKYK